MPPWKNQGGIFMYLSASVDKAHQVAVAFGFHLLVGNKSQSSAVDAIARSGWRQAVVFKNVPQMRVSSAAADFGPGDT